MPFPRSTNFLVSSSNTTSEFWLALHEDRGIMRSGGFFTFLCDWFEMWPHRIISRSCSEQNSERSEISLLVTLRSL